MFEREMEEIKLAERALSNLQLKGEQLNQANEYIDKLRELVEDSAREDERGDNLLVAEMNRLRNE